MRGLAVNQHREAILERERVAARQGDLFFERVSHAIEA